MLFDKIASLSKQSLVYGIGHVLARFISFLLLPFYSHLIPPEEYGVLILIYIFIALAQILCVAGLDIAFLRYYVAEDEKKQKSVFSTAFFALTVISGFLNALFFFFPGLITAVLFHSSVPENAEMLIRLSCGILLFDSLAVIPFFSLRGDQKPVHFTVLKLSNVLINIAGNIILVAVMGLGVMGALWANLIAAVFTFILLTPVIVRKFGFDFNSGVIRNLWKFGLPNVPALIFLLVIEFSDRKLLEVYRGLEEAGLYSAGYKMGMFMAILTTAFRFAWQPFFLSEAKNPEAKQLFARIFTYFFLTAGFLFMLFMFYAPDILEWKLPLWNISILDPRYWPGMAVFPIILLAHLFDGIYSNFTVGVYLKNKTKVVPLIIGMGAVFNLGANFIVIPVHGMMGAAWTTLGAFIIMAVSLQLYIRRIYYIPYEWSRIFKLGLIIMVLSALYFFYPKFILWRLMLTVLFPILLLITGFFGKTELIRLKNLVSRGR